MVIAIKGSSLKTLHFLCNQWQSMKSFLGFFFLNYNLCTLPHHKYYENHKTIYKKMFYPREVDPDREKK